jgi:hypothetical protein
MSLTKKEYYSRTVPVMVLAGILCLCFSAWGSMTGGWSARYPDYQSTLLTIYGYVLVCYIPAFLLMLIKLRAGVIVFWCLIAVGGVLFCASGFKDGAMMVSGYSIVIPLLGRYVQGLRARRSSIENDSTNDRGAHL